jgi:DNA-directed RNA polymerase subunit M/transcription elongation factor TFIIS
MPVEQPHHRSPLHDAKVTCTAHRCPKCGTEDHVSVEQVLTGASSVTWCHCRACGHSWHPVALA